MTRTVNSAAMAILDASEGCFLTGNLDPVGIPQAGYGHTGPDVKVGQVYTMAQVLAWQVQDMATAAACVERNVTVTLNDNQFSALADFVYNVGAGAFESSTLLKLLNAGNYAAVPGQLAKWVNAKGKPFPGLVTRRAHEAALFVTPVEVAASTIVRYRRNNLATPTPKPSAPSWAERLRTWWHNTFVRPVIGQSTA